jgi:hypothetical protein
VRHLFAGPPQHVDVQQDFAVCGRNPFQRAVQHRAVDNRFGHVVRVHGFPERLHRDADGHRAVLAPGVDGEVPGSPEQPGQYGPFAPLQPVRVHPRPQQRLLDDVLGMPQIRCEQPGDVPPERCPLAQKPVGRRFGIPGQGIR